MLSNRKSNQKGFTIIEVLIVLAIAGLILLIVFLAVPALQRNSRNTSKRADTSKALGAVGEWVSANNGKVPSTTNDITAIQTSANLSGGTTLVNVAPPTSIAGVTGAGVLPGMSTILIVTGVTCNQGATVATSTSSQALTAANWQSMLTAGPARSYVALYSVEATGGQQTTQCQGS